MNFSKEDKIRIEHQFDTYIKKVARNHARNLWKERKRREEIEPLFSELPASLVADFRSPSLVDYVTSFQVYRSLVDIENEQLSMQLSSLDEEKRKILLLYYFINMTDVEIGQLIGKSYDSVKKTRLRTLEQIRKQWR